MTQNKMKNSTQCDTRSNEEICAGIQKAMTAQEVMHRMLHIGIERKVYAVDAEKTGRYKVVGVAAYGNRSEDYEIALVLEAEPINYGNEQSAQETKNCDTPSTACLMPKLADIFKAVGAKLICLCKRLWGPRE